MPIPFRIRFDAVLNMWVPDHPELRDAASTGNNPNISYTDKREGLFYAVEPNFPGEYTLEMPIEMARSYAFARVDQRTDEILGAGVSFEGKQFSLSLEAQVRYIGMIVFAGVLAYPIQFNTLDDGDVVLIEDQQDIIEFCAVAIARVRAVIDSGTVQKDVVRAETDMNTALNYADPRSLT